MNTFEKVALVVGVLAVGVFIAWLAWPHVMRRIFGEGPKI